MKTEAESRINKENDDNTAEKYAASRGPNEVNQFSQDAEIRTNSFNTRFAIAPTQANSKNVSFKSFLQDTNLGMITKVFLPRATLVIKT